MSSGKNTYLSSQESTGLAIFTSAQILIGTTANLCVIVYFLFFCYRKQKTPSDQLTLNLAISDLVALTTYLPWRTHLLVLRKGTSDAYIYSSLYVVAIVATGNAITCIALDRYTAVVWPLRYKTLITSRVTSAAIALSWLSAILLGILHGFFYKRDGDLHQDYELFLSSLAFGQLLLLSAIYGVLLRIARKHVKNISNMRTGRCQTGFFLKRSIFTAFTIMCLFYITFLPYCIYRVYSRLDESLTSRDKHTAWRWLTAFSFVNSCCNPFVYTFGIERQRSRFKKCFRAFLKRRAAGSLELVRNCNDMEDQV